MPVGDRRSMRIAALHHSPAAAISIGLHGFGVVRPFRGALVVSGSRGWRPRAAERPV